MRLVMSFFSFNHVNCFNGFPMPVTLSFIAEDFCDFGGGHLQGTLVFFLTALILGSSVFTSCTGLNFG